MTTFLQVLVTGVLLGIIYTLLGSGLTLVLGVLRVVNLAHGTLIIIGSFVTFDLFTAWGIDPVWSVLLTMPLFFVAGCAFEGVVLRRVASDSQDRAMLVLFGVMIVAEALATLGWSTDSRSIDVGYANSSFSVGGVIIPEDYLIMSGVAVVVLGLVELFLYRTHLGRAMRAVGQSRETVEILGVNASLVSMVVFGLGTALAAAAGAALGVLFPASIQGDSQWLAYSFVVVLVGGLGGVRSSLVGGLVLGIGQSVFSQLFSLSVVPVILYGGLALALIVRGGGLGVATSRRI